MLKGEMADTYKLKVLLETRLSSFSNNSLLTLFFGVFVVLFAIDSKDLLIFNDVMNSSLKKLTKAIL